MFSITKLFQLRQILNPNLISHLHSTSESALGSRSNQQTHSKTLAMLLGSKTTTLRLDVTFPTINRALLGGFTPPPWSLECPQILASSVLPPRSPGHVQAFVCTWVCLFRSGEVKSIYPVHTVRCKACLTIANLDVLLSPFTKSTNGKGSRHCWLLDKMGAAGSCREFSELLLFSSCPSLLRCTLETTRCLGEVWSVTWRLDLSCLQRVVCLLDDIGANEQTAPNSCTPNWRNAFYAKSAPYRWPEAI